MPVLKIEINDSETAFRPGERLAGRASWRLEKTPRAARARLFWRTMGKGTEDVQIEDDAVFESPMENDSRSFYFQLPPAPYSFSGRLISLIWGVELDIKGVKESCSAEFVLSPFETEISL